MTSTFRERSGVVLSVSLTVFFLFLSVFTTGLSQADDSFYLASGVTQPLRFFFRLHNWSPLYFTWFRMLTFVCPNPVWRYFLSWGLLVVLLLLIPVALKIRYAWIYVLIILVASLPAASPYSGLFEAVLAVFALCLVLRTQLSFSGALAASCVACFVIAQCRTEYDNGVYLSAVATVVAWVVEWRASAATPRSGTSVARALAPVVMVAVLSLCTVEIATHATNQRSGMAFAQHFNVRAALRGVMPYDQRMWWSDYAERMFGIDLEHNASTGTATIGDFFKANPKLFLKHVVSNAVEPKTALAFVFVMYALLLPWLRADARRLRPASLFLGVLVVPVLMDLWLIFPRDHYFVMLLPMVILFALQALRSERLLQPRVPLVLVTAMVAMTFFKIVLPRLRHEAVSPEQVSLSQVECLRTIDRTVSPSNPLVFNPLYLSDVYFVVPRTEVKTMPTWADFKAWAVEKHPAWIMVSPTFAADNRITPAELSAFLGGELGYEAHDCAARAQLTVYAPKGR